MNFQIVSSVALHAHTCPFPSLSMAFFCTPFLLSSCNQHICFVNKSGSNLPTHRVNTSLCVMWTAKEIPNFSTMSEWRQSFLSDDQGAKELRPAVTKQLYTRVCRYVISHQSSVVIIIISRSSSIKPLSVISLSMSNLLSVNISHQPFISGQRSASVTTHVKDCARSVVHDYRVYSFGADISEEEPITHRFIRSRKELWEKITYIIRFVHVVSCENYCSTLFLLFN